MICFTSFPLCRLLVNSRTRSRSFFVAFGLGHRCMKCLSGHRWMLRFFQIVQPKNTRPSLPRLKSTNRVFAGCSVGPSRSITNPIRRSASFALDSVAHSATKSSAYRTSFSMLPTERHFCRSGHTAHGTAVSYSAWHTPIAGSGVVVLFHWGCWSSLTCPRTYLLPSSIKAGPLPSTALSCAASQVLRTPRTPCWLRRISACRLYTHGLCLTLLPLRLPGRVSPVPRCSFPTCHRLRPRGGPAPASLQDAVCCLRRDMSGSALPNTFG